MVKVVVSDKNKLDFAVRLFKKKVQKEKIVNEAKERKEFEKPCEKRKRKMKENSLRRKKVKK